MGPLTVYLVRHAPTAGNLERRYIGVTDEPLCPEGQKRVAETCLDIPPADVVYTSGMVRTAQTASVLFPQAEQVAVPDLHEMDFGTFEGRTADEMADDAAYREWVDGWCLGRCPQGEDRAGFVARVCKGFDALAEDAQRRGLSQVAAVVHGGTIMALLSSYAEPAKDYYDWHASWCHGYVCACERVGGAWRMVVEREL